MTRERVRAVAAWISLFVVAIASMLLWREEVFRHGWDGLTWTGYCHWAVPEGVALFLLWLAIFCGVTPPIRRVAFVLAAAVFSLVVHRVVRFSVAAYFGGLIIWPQDSPTREVMLVLLRDYSFYWVVPAIPVFACWGAKVFGVRVTWPKWILSVGLFLAAGPISIYLLHVTQHVGRADGIHTVKSGYVIPFLMIALAIPFLPVHTRAKPPDGLDAE